MNEDIYRIGMPETAFAGLSENWVLRTCGHRHWRMMESALNTQASGISDRARLVEPEIPMIAENGIPIRDELELALSLS